MGIYCRSFSKQPNFIKFFAFVPDHNFFNFRHNHYLPGGIVWTKEINRISSGFSPYDAAGLSIVDIKYDPVYLHACGYLFFLVGLNDF